MSMAFVRFCLIVPLLYPAAVVLSFSIGVGGCLCPNSSNVVLSTAPYFALMKTAPISASTAEDITCLRFFADDQNCSVGKFFVVFGGVSHVKKNPSPAFGFIF
jgi:hypothetical protein